MLMPASGSRRVAGASGLTLYAIRSPPLRVEHTPGDGEAWQTRTSHRLSSSGSPGRRNHLATRNLPRRPLSCDRRTATQRNSGVLCPRVGDTARLAPEEYPPRSGEVDPVELIEYPVDTGGRDTEVFALRGAESVAYVGEHRQFTIKVCCGAVAHDPIVSGKDHRDDPGTGPCSARDTRADEVAAAR